MKSARVNPQGDAKNPPPLPKNPPRGGSGGPCNHCQRTYSPCWRKGPPEKPLLCNACGAHYLVKKSLDGYRPGQKGARAQASPAKKPATPAKRSKKKGQAEADEISSDTGTSGGSPKATAGAKGGRKGGNTDVASGGKRKRAPNKRYHDANDDSDDGNGGSRQKPNLSVNTIARRESMSDVMIASTPMAINLLADMADRRKKQAPPPIWELTSPRGIEGAKQRTFNALMKTPPPPVGKVRPPAVKGQEEAMVQDKDCHLAPDPGCLLEADCLEPLGASILEEHPYLKDTVLHAPDSPLPMVDMTDIVNTSSWESVVTMPPASSCATDIASLSTLVPECDRDLASVGCIKDTMFSSPAFASAMENFQGLLASGKFDKDTSASILINNTSVKDDPELKRLPLGGLDSMIVPLPIGSSLQSTVKKSEAVPLFAHDATMSPSTLQASPATTPGALSLVATPETPAAQPLPALHQQLLGDGGSNALLAPLGIPPTATGPNALCSTT